MEFCKPVAVKICRLANVRSELSFLFSAYARTIRVRKD